MRILSWNVAGLRAVLRKDPACLRGLVHVYAPDVICLQETRVQQVPALGPVFDGWNVCLNAADRPGYSGVMTLSKTPPLDQWVPDWDTEGRIIVTEFERACIVNVYVPNSGTRLVRLQQRIEGWDPTLFRLLSDLRARKPMVVAGDLNCARTGMDVYDAKRLVRSPGFTIEERMSLDAFLKSGWIDSFREKHPTLRRYTYFSNRNGARHRNVGWRLDYVLLSAGLSASSVWIDGDIALSDHQPMGMPIQGSRCTLWCRIFVDRCRLSRARRNLTRALRRDAASSRVERIMAKIRAIEADRQHCLTRLGLSRAVPPTPPV